MYTKEQIQKAYKTLSRKMKELVMSPELHSMCENIFVAHNIQEEKRRDIESLVVYIILGLDKKNELQVKIDTIINDKNVSNSLTEDILKKILDDTDKTYFETLKSIEVEEKNKGNDFSAEDYLSKIEVESINTSSQTIKINAEKIEDIEKKYSLNPIQKNQLLSLISQKTSTSDINLTTDSLMNKLGISMILSEQILDDLKTRSFTSSQNKKEVKEKFVTRIPEIKPANLPAIEIGEVAHDYVPEKPKTSPVQVSEPVQKPYSVPRFGMDLPKIPPVINMNQNKPISPQNMMNGKLNNITTATPEKTPPSMPTTKYTIDPYREPLS